MSSILGGLFVWLAQRLVGKAAIQEAATAYLHEVLDQMRTELRVALRERDKARKDSTEKDVVIEELRTTIRVLERELAQAKARVSG